MHFGKVFLGDHYVESNTLITTTKSMTKREVDQWATYGLTTPFLDCLMISLLYNNILPEKKSPSLKHPSRDIYNINIFPEKNHQVSNKYTERYVLSRCIVWWFNYLIPIFHQKKITKSETQQNITKSETQQNITKSQFHWKKYKLIN